MAEKRGRDRERKRRGKVSGTTGRDKGMREGRRRRRGGEVR